jgi:hypothetical protein
MIVAFTAIAAASMAAGGSGAASAQASTTCTWGGTPAAPTGTFEFPRKGLTNTPASEPLPFTATGPLGGGCSGTFTYRGQANALSTCSYTTFEGTAKGLPGVARWAAQGVAGLAPAVLFNKAGEVVGSENPQVLTSATEEQNLGFTNCNSPEGVKKGNFGSVIELTG